MKTIALLSALCLSSLLSASTLEPAFQAKVDARIKTIQAWGSDPILVSAVKAQNASLPGDLASMTQDKWKAASVLDPVVRALTKNPVAEFLKKQKDEGVAEAFVSDANGCKVGFLGKPTSWSHKGKAKHDDPMANKTWQGDVELDESTGLQQVQIAVPILDGTKPIGSLVVGLAISKLK
jgi:hypothetical protein